MKVLTISEAIHFVEQDPTTITEIKEDLFSEINSFYNFILNATTKLQMDFKSVDDNLENEVKINYFLGEQHFDFESWLSSFRYLKLTQSPIDKLSKNSLNNSEYSVLNIHKKLWFKPVGKILNSPIEPTVMPLLTKERTNSRFQIPLVRRINFLQSNARWRNLLKALSQVKGKLTIQIQIYQPEQWEKIYAWQCLNLYIDTYQDKIAADDFEANTQIFRALIEDEPIFSVKILTFSENNEFIKLAFLQDLDIKAFEIRNFDNSSQKSTKYNNLDHKIQNFIHKLPHLWLQDEIIECLLTPPYSFGDALPGMKPRIPLPFNIPYLQQNSDRSLALGKVSDSQQIIYLDRELLRRHLFVTGSNGSGKTNTIHHLATQLSDVPILIIDPIKTEYEALMKARGKSDKIIDFYRGNIPQFNPFIPAPNITVYDHISIIARVLAILSPANEAALSLIQNMVKNTYWGKLNEAIRNNRVNLPGKNSGEPIDLDDFLEIDGQFLRNNPACIPSFNDYLEISLQWLKDITNEKTRWGIETIQYFERRAEFLQTSLFKKVVDSNLPVDRYFESDYLIELGRISEPTEKNALFTLFTLLLYEHRRSQGIQDKLQHITILEEAHRIIPGQTQKLGENIATSAEQEAATLVAQMLAEIRAFGEGIIIVDQSPNKILSDALINCNTKIIHRLGYGKDKETLAEALSLSEREKNFLSYLERGKAIALHPDLNQPIYLTIPKADTA